MGNVTLFGWTFAQWAEVAAYYKRFGPLPDTTINGASIVRIKWLSNCPQQPGEHRIIDVAHEMEWAWASMLMERIIRELSDNPLFQVSAKPPADARRGP